MFVNPQTQISGKSDRINFRTSSERKQLILEAAALRGQSASEFAESALFEKALEVVRDTQVLMLTNQDSLLLERLLQRDPERPNPALEAATREFGPALEIEG